MTLNNKIKFFKNEIKYWINYFGLHNYSIIFDTEDDENNCACCIPNSIKELNSERMITFTYSKSWVKDEDDLNEISRIAFHEIFELLLLRLRMFAENKKVLVNDREIDDEVHSIIRVMENKVFTKLYRRK